MPRAGTSRKARKTFSLSRESLSYLESLRKERRNDSMSAILEEIIRRQQQAEAMQRISASVASYYDSFSDEQVVEDSTWGEFAETQFSGEE